MKIFTILLFFTLLFSHLSVLAEEAEPELSIDPISTVLYKIEADIKDERFLPANKGRLEKRAEFFEDEPSDVAFFRKSLSDNKDSLVSTQASCKAIIVRSKTAIKNISQFRTDNLVRKSFDRGINTLTVLQKIIPVKDFSESGLTGLLESI